MKLPLLAASLFILTSLSPLALASCGCTLDTLTPTATGPWLTPDDITRMQQNASTNGWTFTVSDNPAIHYAKSQLCGLVPPPNWWVNASFDPCLPTQALPDRWDWREHNGVTPVKNQGGCGSCWAFGTIGPVESAILIHDNVTVDLSEQWLVSCNQNQWGCHGGWWAHDYFQYKTDKFNGSGAVLEQEFPYTATDEPCNGPYHHPYHIDSWHYIGYSLGVPSVDAIKNAIYTYGPVSAGVAVNDAFGGYDGGVFNNNTSAPINHAITLVGWDDTLGTNGVWILKNSWDTGWGMDGYMYIEYGCCKVGYGACYVVYPAKIKLEPKSSPFGLKILFTNQGNTTVTNIEWTIVYSGGFASLVNVSLADSIIGLGPSEVYPKRVSLFGLGPIQVKVLAVPENAGKQSMTASGFLLGTVLIMHQP